METKQPVKMTCLFCLEKFLEDELGWMLDQVNEDGHNDPIPTCPACGSDNVDYED